MCYQGHDGAEGWSGDCIDLVHQLMVDEYNQLNTRIGKCEHYLTSHMDLLLTKQLWLMKEYRSILIQRIEKYVKSKL